MTYYAFIQNNKINGCGQCRVLNEDVLSVEVTEEQYNLIIEKGKNYFIYQNGEIIINPNYEQEQKEQEEKEFNRKFFNTSLGYVSRDVHMKNGTVKDFLTDILPLLKVGIPVLVYTRELVQSKVPATQQFIDECGQQLIADFYGEN